MDVRRYTDEETAAIFRAVTEGNHRSRAEGVMRLIHLAATCLVSLCIVAHAEAQVPAPSRPHWLASCGTDAPGLGAIAGQLVADTAGIRLGPRAVTALNACTVAADSSGHFAIRGLPPGMYVVTVGDLFLAPVIPLRVNVAAGGTSTITIHLAPENRILDCESVAECAVLIEPAAPALVDEMAEADRVREVAYRAAIMMSRSRTGSDWRTPPPARVYCLAVDRLSQSADSAVVAAVRHRFPTATAVNGCDRGPPGRPTPVWVAGTHDRAYLILVHDIVINGDSATASAVGDGEQWRCLFARDASGWRPTSCKTIGVS
jgi:hypothetical protein